MISAKEAAQMQNHRAECRAAAIENWRSAPAKRGSKAFFQLGIALNSADLSTADVEDVLRLETGNARHPAERRREIKRIIKKLRASSRAGGCLTVGETSRQVREAWGSMWQRRLRRFWLDGGTVRG